MNKIQKTNDEQVQSSHFQEPSATSPPAEEIEYLVTLMRSSRYTEAETFARKITESFPEYGFSWKILGTSLLLQDRMTESLPPMQKAAELLPGDPDVQLNLAVTLHNLGRLVEAEAGFRRVLEIKPDYAIGHNNLGNTLRNMRRLDEAEVGFRRALAINPDFVEAHMNLGYTLNDTGRLKEAEACFRRVLLIKPDFVEAQINLGDTLRGQRRLDESIVHYRLALKAKGDWKEWLHRLTDPLVLTTGIILGPYFSATNLVEVKKQTSTLIVQENHHRKRLDATGDPEPPSIARKQRIILIYPPPYQIPSDGKTVRMGMPFGPPLRMNDREIDGDSRIITYGLLSIAAQAKRAGYDVSVYNLCTLPWREVVKLIAENDADVYGISAFTANRRGMGAVAEVIRQFHPHAHITVGGPFVTSVPAYTLRYYQEIDTAVIGEGEDTFMALLDHLDTGRPVTGIPGTAWREGDKVIIGPARPRIHDLDVLASPFDYFTSHVVMTSRGCPGKCSFCSSFNTWGKKLCFHSAEATLNIFKKALGRQPIPFLAVKDDTFTASRQRAVAICDAIIGSKMNFLWSCDTRVDCIDDELLRKMRLAGCQTISFGVESGSPEILKTMNKRTTPEMVLKATRSAQKYGIFVRYYMILINRGETAETIQQSIDLIKAGRPNDYGFAALSFNPGTEDWKILCEKQRLTPDIFFRNDFKSLDVTRNRYTDFNNVLLKTECDIGSFSGFDYTAEEREAIVDRLPNLHSVYVELGNAYFRAGRYKEASSALDRAEELNFPINSIIVNQRACIAVARNDISSARSLLESASRFTSPQIVMKNLVSLRDWANAQVENRSEQLLLDDSIQAIDFSAQQSQPAQLTPL